MTPLYAPPASAPGATANQTNCTSVAAGVRAALHGGRRRATTSALGLSIVLSASAFAQTANDGAQPSADSDATDLGEIVVTGIRRQLETSQARKQDATELVDAVTADDIGALPDRSVTEVLQRIPGLAIGRVPQPRDADRIAIEGAGVTIRGLSWVRSELNGHTAFSAKNSRVLGFEDIPPEMLAGVDVYKNPSAQQVEGGLSGTVNLRTRLPFDSEDRKFSFSAEGAWGDLAEELGTVGIGVVQRLDRDIVRRHRWAHFRQLLRPHQQDRHPAHRQVLREHQSLAGPDHLCAGWHWMAPIDGRPQPNGCVGRIAMALAR